MEFRDETTVLEILLYTCTCIVEKCTYMYVLMYKLLYYVRLFRN